MKRIFGVVAVLVTLSACTATEMKELEASDKMEDKAENYCSITMGYADDPKTLGQCKEHYIQGMMDANKTK